MEAVGPRHLAPSSPAWLVRRDGNTALAVLIGARLTIVLIFLGALVPALVVAVATAAAWARPLNR